MLNLLFLPPVILLECTLRQPTRRIPSIHAVFILILAGPLLHTPQRTTIRRAAWPPILIPTIHRLFDLAPTPRWAKPPTNTAIQPLPAPRHPAPRIAFRPLAARYADPTRSDHGVVLSSQTREPTTRVNGADVCPDALQRREGAALGLDLADGVLPDTGVEVLSRAVEPAAFLQEEVCRHAGGFALQVVLLREGLVEGGDRFVDFLAFDARGGFEALNAGFFAHAGGGGLLQFAEEDVPVCEGFFHDEGVAAVVGEGVAKGSRFSGALRGVIIACCLDDATEFAVGVGEARVRFLYVHLGELLAEGGFCEAEG